MEVPLLITDFLDRAVRLYPDKTACVDGALRLSYQELDERVNRMANALLDLGLERGDRVCMLSPNSHFYLESFYATAQVGIVLVPLNYRLTAADHAYILNHAGVAAVLVDGEYTQVVDEIRDQLPQVRHWIAAQDEGDPAAGWTSWNALCEAASAEKPPLPADLGENDLVSINYTSGTTSRPKGVMMTHRNVYLNAYNMIVHLGIRHQDVELWTLPMFHCNGWGGVYALTALAGTHVILRAIDGDEILRLIADEHVTLACMAPAVLRTVLDTPDRDRFSFETQPRFTVAGAPPPAAFIERLEEELGWEFIQIYGLTETAPLLTISRPDAKTEKNDWARRSRAGVAGIGVDLVVMGDDGKPVAKDGVAVGEICARSNVVFAGYYEQPEQTDAAIYDGYFHTGDLAVWDEFENVHIVDRKKDVIISGGENISSPEIEDCLYQHAAVLECAVIGVPHEKWGETPVALVVTRDGEQVSDKDLIAFCRDRLAHFKCPHPDSLRRGASADGDGQAPEIQAPRDLLERRPQGRRLSTRENAMSSLASTARPSRARSLALVTLAYVVALLAGALTLALAPIDGPLARTFAADVVATLVIYGFSFRYDNSSFYDAYWSVIPIAIALYWMTIAQDGVPVARTAAVLAVVTVWGTRLTFNWARGWTGLEHEDWRYVDFRAHGPRRYWLISLAALHFFPTLIVFAGLAALYPALTTAGRAVGPLDALALAVGVVGIAFEWIADEQLRAFVTGSRKAGETLRRGLWRYSRHPNYLGEILVWWSLFLFGMAADSSWGARAVAAPLAMTAMFVLITIPMLEKRSLARRGRLSAGDRRDVDADPASTATASRGASRLRSPRSGLRTGRADQSRTSSLKTSKDSRSSSEISPSAAIRPSIASRKSRRCAVGIAVGSSSSMRGGRSSHCCTWRSSSASRSRRRISREMKDRSSGWISKSAQAKLQTNSTSRRRSRRSSWSSIHSSLTGVEPTSSAPCGRAGIGGSALIQGASSSGDRLPRAATRSGEAHGRAELKRIPWSTPISLLFSTVHSSPRDRARPSRSRSTGAVGAAPRAPRRPWIEIPAAAADAASTIISARPRSLAIGPPRPRRRFRHPTGASSSRRLRRVTGRSIGQLHSRESRSAARAVAAPLGGLDPPHPPRARRLRRIRLQWRT